jgi:hypothetical protein
MDLKDFTKLYNIITENPLDTMLINVHKKVISRNIVEEQYDVSNLMNIQNVLANL